MMNIKVLGSGCKKCQKLEANVKEALVLLNKEADVDHITDYNEIVSYNVMSTPALVVDGKVVSSGRLLTPRQLVELLK